MCNAIRPSSFHEHHNIVKELCREPEKTRTAPQQCGTWVEDSFFLHEKICRQKHTVGTLSECAPLISDTIFCVIAFASWKECAHERTCEPRRKINMRSSGGTAISGNIYPHPHRIHTSANHI